MCLAFLALLFHADRPGSFESLLCRKHKKHKSARSHTHTHTRTHTHTHTHTHAHAHAQILAVIPHFAPVVPDVQPIVPEDLQSEAGEDQEEWVHVVEEGMMPPLGAG